MNEQEDRKLVIIALFIFEDNWLGVLHHIAGEHEWLDGECVHGPLVAEGGKTYLNKNSKAFEAIRNIVLDQRFLKSLNHYVTFRYITNICLCFFKQLGWYVYHYVCTDV